MKHVYLASPYNQELKNVMFALRFTDELEDKVPDIAVFCPHLFHYRNMFKERPEAYWLKVDFSWLERCDAVFRMPGLSDGADKEVKLAEKLGKPVFKDVDSLYEWAVKK